MRSTTADTYAAIVAEDAFRNSVLVAEASLYNE